MLNNIPVSIFIGSLLGFLSGIGTGGGSLLMLWLTVILQIPINTARSINLLFFLPSAAIATLFRWKQGHFSPKKVLPAILAGSIASAVFTLLSRHIETEMLRKLFGILLLFTGIRELLYHPKQR